MNKEGAFTPVFLAPAVPTGQHRVGIRQEYASGSEHGCASFELRINARSARVF